MTRCGPPLDAASLGALVSSKVDQWTLLVGTIPLVFNLASYVIGKPMPQALVLDQVQRADLLVTSAQSAFAVAVLLGLHLSLLEAGLLAGLFLVHFFIPDAHTAITISYLVLSVVFGFRHRAQIVSLIRGAWSGQATLNVQG